MGGKPERRSAWRLHRGQLLAALLAALLPGVARAQDAGPAPELLRQHAWQTWSSESGLPQISGKALARDRNGLLWVGTENGLARFDGSQFETFTPGTTPALAASWITHLRSDEGGAIWIGTLRNLAVHVDGTFLGSPDIGEVGDLAVLDDGSVLVGGASLWRARIETGALTLAAEPGWHGPVRRMLVREDGGRWLLRGQRELWWWPPGGAPEPATLPPEIGLVSALLDDGRTQWLGTDAGLYRYQDGRFVMDPVAPGQRSVAVQSLGIDASGTLWIGSFGELVLRHADGQIEAVEPGAPEAFPWIVSFLATPEGVWLGSQYHGIRHYWRPGIRRHGQRDGLPDPTVWSFAMDGERVLVGTDRGVAAWSGGRFEPLLVPENLPHPAVYALLADPGGRLWAGTRAGLVRRDPGAAGLFVYAALDGVQVNGLLALPGRGVLVAAASGLLLADDTGVVERYPGSPLGGRRVRSLVPDADEGLWIATETGLFRAVGEQVEAVPEAGLDGAFVTSVRLLPDGRVAVGSYDRGIAVGRGQGPWLRLGHANGLPSDTVFNLFEHDGTLLVSYHDGVYRLPAASFAEGSAPDMPRSFEMLLLDQGERPGRSRIRCCNGAGNDKGILLADRILLPSLAGVVELPLDARPAPPPRAEVLELVIGGQARAPAPLVILPVGVRDFEVGFRAVDFRDAARQRFRYRLDGFDAAWLEVAGRPRASFTRLPPGRYRFQVQARLTQQPWGPTAGFELVVPRRFVEGWPFRIQLLLAAIGLVAVLFRWRLHRLNLQRLALEAKVDQRTRDLALANARLESLNRDLAEASLVDPLTQLRNRRFVLERMPGLLAQVRRQRQESGRDLVLGLMLVDADRFKQINDRYGHETGDRVLCRIAQALREAVRAGDEVVRWGGEEFLVVLPGVARADLVAVAERIRTGIEAAPGAAGQPTGVTASVGAAGWPLSPDGGERHDWQVALSMADFALYRAKDAGRNRSAMLDMALVAPDAWPDRPDATFLQGMVEARRLPLRIEPTTAP
ncbi:MAG: diguanylate cyclase [Xanthomonadales bacterium]|nr:diguanylate cyclase [Xanthomonadales bacterium]